MGHLKPGGGPCIYRTFVPGVDGRLSRKGVTRSTRATRAMLRPLLPERSYESISRLRRPVGGEEGRGWCHVGSKDVLMVLKAYRGSPKPIARRSRPIGMLLTCCWAARDHPTACSPSTIPGVPALLYWLWSGYPKSTLAGGRVSIRGHSIVLQELSKVRLPRLRLRLRKDGDLCLHPREG